MADSFEKYFQGYAYLFERRDAEAIASFYYCPCPMVGKDAVVTFTTPETILNNTRGLVEGDQGPQRYRASEFRVERQSENLTIVCLRWSVTGDQDEVLSSWLNTDQLVVTMERAGKFWSRRPMHRENRFSPDCEGK